MQTELIRNVAWQCSNSDNVTWSLNDVSSASEGLYLCSATNSAGSSVARTHLDITGEAILLQSTFRSEFVIISRCRPTLSLALLEIRLAVVQPDKLSGRTSSGVAYSRYGNQLSKTSRGEKCRRDLRNDVM